MNFTRDDVRTIFGQMDLLIKFSTELLIDLKKCLPEFVRRRATDGKDVSSILKVLSEEQATRMCFEIASVFIKYTPFMLFYTTYANNFATSQATLRRLRRQDSFKKWLFDQRIRSDELGTFVSITFIVHSNDTLKKKKNRPLRFPDQTRSEIIKIQTSSTYVFSVYRSK